MKIETTNFENFEDLSQKSYDEFSKFHNDCLNLYSATKQFCENLVNDIKSGKF